MDEAKRQSLIRLLKDDDDRIAGAAMQEILRADNVEQNDFLGEYQDCDDPMVRKRIQQLSSTVTLRRRRKDFLAMTERSDLDLAEGLIEVHLQWFDNDARPGLQKNWHGFLKQSSERYRPNSLEKLRYFFHKNDFHAEVESSANPEFYCLGVILEDRGGASSMLAAIGKLIAAKAGLSLRVVRVLGEFALLDHANNALLLRNDFHLGAVNPTDCEECTDGMLLKYASLMLFSHAVVSDSFRYIQTIGQSLGGTPDELPLDFLPYPYSSKNPETRRKTN